MRTCKSSFLPGSLLGILLIAATVSGCKTDPVENSGPELSGTFIPEANKKFRYKVETEGDVATATQWITERMDSSGIAVFNVHTDFQSDGFLITMDNRTFSLAGKTYTELKVPDAWQMSINLLNQMPDTKVTKAELFGFPAFITMDNPIRDGSVLEKVGSPEQGQRVSYVSHGEVASMEQVITLEPGTATVETIEVPAGSFVCNRFSYVNRQKITTTTKDNQYTGDGEEKITVWMAHGVGMVKQQSASQLVSFMPLPTGEIRKVTTSTTSTTTLEQITQ